jgi:hypothetical protein
LPNLETFLKTYGDFDSKYSQFSLKKKLLKQWFSRKLPKNRSHRWPPDTSHDKISRDKAAFAVRDSAVAALKESYPGDSFGPVQGCQMVYFQTKNPKLGKFWRVLQRKILIHFMFIWYIYSHSVHFIVIWYIFPRFGMM